VTSAERRESREYKLRMAIDKAAGITLADFRVFNHLLNVADFSTSFLPDRFQPRSLKTLAADCHVSVSQVKYSVGHLQRHGWLLRHRNLTDQGIGGRGHPTRYVLEIGHDCDCKSGQPVAGSRKKGATECPAKGPQEATVSAGHPPVSAGRAVAGGKREGRRKPWIDEHGDYTGGPVAWEWPADSYGEEANPR
jgi:DNA-binding MarR family transcriptional regulator